MVTAMVDTDNESKKEVLVRLGLGVGVLGTIVALWLWPWRKEAAQWRYSTLGSRGELGYGGMFGGVCG
ncbi:putative pollen-specific leucine-rich repeat extensin-like protein 3 [Iris pallida]|uniref:Pollen-specific leucine-rich repeat extensin-like protein 3 n=1 Tax=Iris pallida TaxID=29817 RepID=A0AAX6HPS5_IRIPA|nr:putative pollen-specific leucine-rich repeat extensin-like protein 3 [Iris pallida]